MEINNDEVIACARYGELDDLKLLLEVKSDVNHQDNNGSNALHMACGNGHLDTVKYLSSQKAAWTKNSAGNTPLHWCALNKHVAVAEFLLRTEPYCSLIDVFSPNAAGKSAVAMSFDNGCSELVVKRNRYEQKRPKKKRLRGN
jgi:ankyrin repeat protein